MHAVSDSSDRRLFRIVTDVVRVRLSQPRDELPIDEDSETTKHNCDELPTPFPLVLHMSGMKDQPPGSTVGAENKKGARESQATKNPIMTAR